jgi:hypothetical protein
MNANEKTITTMNNNNNNSSNSQISWADKQISLQQVANKIPNGSAVYIGRQPAATAEAALQAMVDDPRLADIQIIQLIPCGCLPHLKERLDRFRTSSFFSFSSRGSYYFKANDRVGSEGLQRLCTRFDYFRTAALARTKVACQCCHDQVYPAS